MYIYMCDFACMCVCLVLLCGMTQREETDRYHLRSDPVSNLHLILTTASNINTTLGYYK